MMANEPSHCINRIVLAPTRSEIPTYSLGPRTALCCKWRGITESFGKEKHCNDKMMYTLSVRTTKRECQRSPPGGTPPSHAGQDAGDVPELCRPSRARQTSCQDVCSTQKANTHKKPHPQPHRAGGAFLSASFPPTHGADREAEAGATPTRCRRPREARRPRAQAQCRGRACSRRGRASPCRPRAPSSAAQATAPPPPVSAAAQDRRSGSPTPPRAAAAAREPARRAEPGGR